MTTEEQSFQGLAQGLADAGLLGALGPAVQLDYAPGKAPPVRVFYADAATQQQRDSVAAALAAWDWAQSPAQLTRRDALRQLADPGGVAKAVRGLAVVVNAELNKLRQAAGLPTRTVAQAAADWQAAITGGAAD